MVALNFPTYSFRFKQIDGKAYIFDCIRKKFIQLQPEEWVRQNCIQYLMQEKGYPSSLINVEKEIHLNGLKKRYDIVVFHPDGSIHLIVECKAPNIAISQATFDQIARYNLTLKSDLLMVTNGINHYYCHMDWQNECYNFLKTLPKYTI